MMEKLKEIVRIVDTLRFVEDGDAIAVARSDFINFQKSLSYWLNGHEKRILLSRPLKEKAGVSVLPLRSIVEIFDELDL